MEHKRMYIGGKWLEASSGKVFFVQNPATLEEIAAVPDGGAEDAILAVAEASKAFEIWSTMTAYERSDIMQRWYQLIKENTEQIASVLTGEQGKPLREAKGEVEYGNSFVQWYLEEAKRVYGETIPSHHKNKRMLVQKQPVGVVAAITPWNFPAAMITRKVAPALAAGCTVVIKPAEQTPLTALLLAELAEKAGFPPGVFNVITGNPQEIGSVLLKDPRVAKVTFTGSTEVGKLIMREAADTVKKISLELGGHAPFIVFDDADLEHAVKHTIRSKFRNAGQTCICANRLYVHKNIRESFERLLAETVSRMNVGYGFDEGTEIGPVIDEQAINKVTSHIEDAVKKGARILTGGNRKPHDSFPGYFFEPTILTGVTHDMLIMQEETFGPVAPVIEFTEEREVVEMANDTPYGLAAYVFTRDISRAIRVVEKLNYGIIGLNDGAPSTAEAPFGGFKQSGIGREGGHHGIEEFLEIKYISIGIY